MILFSEYLLPNDQTHTVDASEISPVFGSCFSIQFFRIEAQEVQDRLPMTYAIYGDQGDYNAQTSLGEQSWQVSNDKKSYSTFHYTGCLVGILFIDHGLL